MYILMILADYPHMSIGKVRIYRLLGFCLFLFCNFVCVCVCVCTVEDLSVLDKASGIKFWFFGVLGRDLTFWETLLPRSSLEAQNRTNRPARGRIGKRAGHSRGPWLADSPSTLATRRIGMLGYTSVPEDGRSCSFRRF